MKQSLPIDVVIDITRFKLYEAISIEGLDRVTPEYLSEAIGLGVTSSFIRIALRQMKALGEIDLQGDTATALNLLNQQFSAVLTAAGARSVEQELRDTTSRISLFRDHGLDGIQEELIQVRIDPERFVDAGENSDVHAEAINALEELQKELATSNEAGEIFGDDRAEIISEVFALNSMINRARVRAAPALALARRTLGWVIEKAGSATVGEIAKRALSAIIHWLTH